VGRELFGVGCRVNGCIDGGMEVYFASLTGLFEHFQLSISVA